jgi:hypothetical protein
MLAGLADARRIGLPRNGPRTGEKAQSKETVTVKRLVTIALLLGSMAFPAAALGFHHGGLPATVCHADAAGSPSNDNGNAKEALLAHNPQGLPLPPIGTPGNGQGDGGEHCANAHED